MNGARPIGLVKVTALAVSMAIVLSGCSYDYLAHSERVSYRAGEAVKANLERETIDPSRKYKRKVTGLGQDGHVIPADPAVTP